MPKLIIVNQCATATIGRRDMRVCPRNSRSNVTVRAPGLSVRFSGAPTLNRATICATARTSSETPMTVMTTQITAATIWRADMGPSLDGATGR